MNRPALLYWTVTGLFCAAMLLSGVMNALATPDSVALIVDHLGFPLWFVRFVGVAKVLGAVALLVPDWPRVKEWAFFGFFLDLFAAIVALVMVGDPVSTWAPLLAFIALLIGAYVLYHRRVAGR